MRRLALVAALLSIASQAQVAATFFGNHRQNTAASVPWPTPTIHVPLLKFSAFESRNLWCNVYATALLRSGTPANDTAEVTALKDALTCTSGTACSQGSLGSLIDAAITAGSLAAGTGATTMACVPQWADAASTIPLTSNPLDFTCNQNTQTGTIKQWCAPPNDMSTDTWTAWDGVWTAGTHLQGHGAVYTTSGTCSNTHQCHPCYYVTAASTTQQPTATEGGAPNSDWAVCATNTSGTNQHWINWVNAYTTAVTSGSKNFSDYIKIYEPFWGFNTGPSNWWRFPKDTTEATTFSITGVRSKSDPQLFKMQSDLYDRVHVNVPGPFVTTPTSESGDNAESNITYLSVNNTPATVAGKTDAVAIHGYASDLNITSPFPQAEGINTLIGILNTGVSGTVSVTNGSADVTLALNAGDTPTQAYSVGMKVSIATATQPQTVNQVCTRANASIGCTAPNHLVLGCSGSGAGQCDYTTGSRSIGSVGVTEIAGTPFSGKPLYDMENSWGSSFSPSLLPATGAAAERGAYEVKHDLLEISNSVAKSFWWCWDCDNSGRQWKSTQVFDCVGTPLGANSYECAAGLSRERLYAWVVGKTMNTLCAVSTNTWTCGFSDGSMVVWSQAQNTYTGLNLSVAGTATCSSCFSPVPTVGTNVYFMDTGGKPVIPAQVTLSSASSVSFTPNYSGGCSTGCTMYWHDFSSSYTMPLAYTAQTDVFGVATPISGGLTINIGWSPLLLTGAPPQISAPSKSAIMLM